MSLSLHFINYSTNASCELPGRCFGGLTLPSGKRAFAVYEGGQIVERYAVTGKSRT